MINSNNRSARDPPCSLESVIWSSLSVIDGDKDEGGELIQLHGSPSWLVGNLVGNLQQALSSMIAWWNSCHQLRIQISKNDFIYFREQSDAKRTVVQRAPSMHGAWKSPILCIVTKQWLWCNENQLIRLTRQPTDGFGWLLQSFINDCDNNYLQHA